MDTLDLNIEQRVNIQIDTASFLNPPIEFFLILSFDLHPFVLNNGIISNLFKVFEDIHVKNPIIRSSYFRKQRRQTRVSTSYPSSRSNTISLILEFSRTKLIEILEQLCC